MGMHDIPGFKILDFEYQRNGVGGEGFHQFLIQFIDDEGGEVQAIATLTNVTDSEDKHPEKFNGSCRVVTPSNFHYKWRGDRFEREIRAQWQLWY